MLNFQGTVYIKNGFHLKITTWGGSILNVNPGSVLIINQQAVLSSFVYLIFLQKFYASDTSYLLNMGCRRLEISITPSANSRQSRSHAGMRPINRQKNTRKNASTLPRLFYLFARLIAFAITPTRKV